MFRRADTIGNRVAGLLRAPEGWERETVRYYTYYRHPDCPFTIKQDRIWYVTHLMDGGDTVPLTAGEERRILRGIRIVDDHLRTVARADALHKFVEKCGA